jgi:peptidoglycan/LPS O-acetylase OafA/YrhL
LFTRLYYPDIWFQPHRLRTKTDYAPQLWTIEIEFYSSMVLFVILTGLVRTRASFRRLFLTVLISYCFYIDRWDIVLFLSGSLIADSILCGTSSCHRSLGNDWVTRSGTTLGCWEYFKSKSIQCYLIQASWFLLLFVSLLTMSYTSIHGVSTIYVPFGAISHSRMTWEAVGSSLLVFSITKIAIVRSLLELSVPQYLGKLSYSLYLVHFPILSAGGWSLLPWVWSRIGIEGWRLVVGYMIAFSLLTPIVIWVSDLWMRLVDDSCVRFGRWVERSVMVQDID